MKNTNRIAITLALIAAFCGTFVLAQTAKPKTVDFKAQAEAATQYRLGQLISYYKPTPDQKAKLKEVLIAQYKDLTDNDKIRAPKIKALDDEIAVVKKKIAELEKEVEAIEKRKVPHAKARAELLLDHKAEIDNVFTPEQRTARLASYIRGSAVGGQYFAVLPKATQDSLVAQCTAAASELIEAGKAEDSEAVRAAYRKIRTEANKVVTPKVRVAGDAKYLLDSTMRKFARLKLTETQKDTIRGMCEKAAKRKIDMYAQYSQLTKDRDAVRRAVSGMSSSSYYYKIRADVVESVLTDAQLKQGGLRRKSSKSGKN
jgi:Spy/CpxP family protein refolding chaperone